MNLAPRLACQQCKQRKIRCDKGTPSCSPCRNAGLSCVTVQRARLPRGKSGQVRKQKQTLENRVQKLESLLKQRKDMTERSMGTETVNMDCTEGGNFLASDFWSALTDSVAGLRDVLDGSEDEDYNDTSATGQRTIPPKDTTSLLFPASGLHPQVPLTVTSEISAALFDLYAERVDGVYKIFHWPTTRAILQADSESKESTHSIQALRYSIYFMALCTVTDGEALTFGFGTRADLLNLCRLATEDSLTKSDLLQHPNMTKLQAFVIYLIGLRTCLNSATAWTLVAVAIRIATALGIDRDGGDRYTPFELELRRRLFYTIGVLDTHAALDRGTVPILPAGAFQSPPLNIDDCDMSPADATIPFSPSEVTDMTHSMMTYKAMLCQRRIYELSQGRDRRHDTWSQRLQLVAGFGSFVDHICDRISRSDKPLHTLLQVSGKKIHSSLELLLRRPPYRQPHDMIPSSDTLDVMLIATEVLEHHMQAPPPELKPWLWKNWIQWHALAVLLVELMVRSQSPLSDRAIAVARNSFSYYATIVADSNTGMLWKPIAKLMRKVERLQESSALAKSPQISNAHNTGEQGLELINFPLMWGKSDEYPICPDPQLPSSHLAQQSLSTEMCYNDQPWSEWDLFLHDITNSYEDEH